MEDLVCGLFPAGRIHLVGGAAGAGKTTLIAQLLKKVQSGEFVFDRATNPATAIYYIAADQFWSEYSHVLGKVGLVPDGHYSFADDPEMNHAKFSAENPIPLLSNALARIDPIPGSVVVIDVLGLFLGSNLLNYRAIMGYMWEYTRWCQKRDITIFGSVHAGKQKGNQERYVRLFDRVMGGGPMRAVCSTASYLTSKEETGIDKGYQEFEVCPRMEGASRFQMVWNQDGLLEQVPEPLAVQSGEFGPVLEVIPHNWPGIATTALVDEITKIAQCSSTRAYEILKSLVAGGWIVKSGTSRKSGWVRLKDN